MDKRDLKIASMLDKHGSYSKHEIARQMEISEATIRRRMGRNIENGIIKNSVLVNIEEFQEFYIAIIGFNLNVHPNSCIQEIQKIPYVINSFAVTGRYDMISVVIIPSRKILSKITKDFFEIGGVNSLETFIATDNYSFKIPAGKLHDILKLQKEYDY